MENLDDGEYTLFFESISDPLVQSSMDFSWPIVEEEIIEEDTVEETEEVEGSMHGFIGKIKVIIVLMISFL